MTEEETIERISEYKQAIKICGDKGQQQILKEELKNGLIKLQDNLIKFQHLREVKELLTKA
jgi:hypothetical protein